MKLNFASRAAGLASIAIVGIVSAVFHGTGLLENPPWHIVYSDIVPFFESAIKPGFPYISKTIEYPVLTGLFVHLMGIVGGSTETGYYIATSLFLIAFAVGTTYFLARLAFAPPSPEASGGRSKASAGKHARSLFLFWIFAPSMFVFMIYNWDIIAIFFTVLGLYMMQREKPDAAAASFACGFASKFYPIIYLAPLVLAQKTRKAHARVIAVFGGIALALNGIFMAASWQNWSYFFVFNRLREANPDSIWTAIQFLTGSLDVSMINIISLILFAASYGIFLWRYRMMSPLFLSFGGTILFLLFNKVFSPQYLLWLLPFFVLMPIKKRWFYALEFANLGALFSILAWFFVSKEGFYLWLTILFVVARHTALAGVLSNLLHKNNPAAAGLF